MTAAQPSYVSTSRRSLDLEDYLDVARRHAGWIAGPAFAGLVLSVVVAFLLPNRYDSRAKLQITPAQVAETLVPSTANQHLADRYAQLQAVVLSRSSLSNLIQSLGLYKETIAHGTLEDAVEEMAKSVKVTPIAPPTNNRRAGSIYEISFQYANRRKAHDTVQALISRFQEENDAAQRDQQNSISTMFGDQMKEARADLDKANEALTSFRVQNSGRLPDQMNANLAALTSLNQQSATASEQLNRLDQMHAEAESRLAYAKAQREAARLLIAQNEEIAPSNPASPAARQNQTLAQLNKQITDGDLLLEQYLQSFTDNYPSVKELKQRLTVLKKNRDELQKQQEKDQAAAVAAEAAAAANPKEVQPRRDAKMTQMIADQDQRIREAELTLNNIESDRKLKAAEQAKLDKEVTVYRDRIAPSGIEARLQDLLRDQKNASDAFQLAFKKQLVTDESSKVVTSGAGEHLEIIDSPSMPSSYAKPSRLLIIGAGFSVSVMLGIAMAAVQEAKDSSLKNLKDVRAYTNLPVLGSIPLLENSMLVKRKRRVGYLIWAAAVIVGLIAICASVFYYFTVTGHS